MILTDKNDDDKSLINALKSIAVLEVIIRVIDLFVGMLDAVNKILKIIIFVLLIFAAVMIFWDVFKRGG